jgi:hypothetical protein
VFRHPRRALGFASPCARGLAVGRRMPCTRLDRQRRAPRARAAYGAPPGGESSYARRRSRSCSARLGDRERNDGRLGQRVRDILERKETESNGAFKRAELRWVTAFGASSQVRSGRARKAQPTAWAAEVGHEAITAHSCLAARGGRRGRPHSLRGCLVGRNRAGVAPALTRAERARSRGSYSLVNRAGEAARAAQMR